MVDVLEGVSHIGNVTIPGSFLHSPYVDASVAQDKTIMARSQKENRTVQFPNMVSQKMPHTKTDFQSTLSGEVLLNLSLIEMLNQLDHGTLLVIMVIESILLFFLVTALLGSRGALAIISLILG